jgi:hypothetical protein
MIPTRREEQVRSAIVSALLEHIRSNQTIKLPPFDPVLSKPGQHYALTNVGAEPNAFGGTVGEFRYQFEGEEDLLHLIVTRASGEPLTVREAQQVAAWVLPDLPSSLVWLRPGTYSQHFYFGHDELLNPSAG